jgi:hypothetical protein
VDLDESSQEYSACERLKTFHPFAFARAGAEVNVGCSENPAPLWTKFVALWSFFSVVFIGVCDDHTGVEFAGSESQSESALRNITPSLAMPALLPPELGVAA